MALGWPEYGVYNEAAKAVLRCEKKGAQADSRVDGEVPKLKEIGQTSPKEAEKGENCGVWCTAHLTLTLDDLA